jgi:hypothetical protein
MCSESESHEQALPRAPLSGGTSSLSSEALETLPIQSSIPESVSLVTRNRSLFGANDGGPHPSAAGAITARSDPSAIRMIEKPVIRLGLKLPFVVELMRRPPMRSIG